MKKTLTFVLASAVATLGYAVPATAQVDVGGAIQGAIEGAARGTARGGNVGDNILRGAARGATGYRQSFRVDPNPPGFRGDVDDVLRSPDLDNQFRTRYGQTMDRNRFRYRDGYWWYRTNDDNWIYDRDGRWYQPDGRPYRGFDAYHSGYRHPNYRYHDGHWWYDTGDQWVFFRNGNWYYPSGRYYAPRRSGFSVGVGPMRLDLFTGLNGRNYRYYNDNWWFRDNNSWYYLKDGYWWHESGRRFRQADPQVRSQLQRRLEERSQLAQRDAEERGTEDRIARRPGEEAQPGDTERDIEQPAAETEGQQGQAEGARTQPWPAPPGEAPEEAPAGQDLTDDELPEAPERPQATPPRGGGTEVPGRGRPDNVTPGADAPGANVPRANVPGANVPGANAPGATTPGATTPGATVPRGGNVEEPGTGVPADAGVDVDAGAAAKNPPGNDD